MTAKAQYARHLKFAVNNRGAAHFGRMGGQDRGQTHIGQHGMDLSIVQTFAAFQLNRTGQGGGAAIDQGVIKPSAPGHVFGNIGQGRKTRQGPD